LPSWYRLTQVVQDKGPLNGSVCVFILIIIIIIPPHQNKLEVEGKLIGMHLPGVKHRRTDRQTDRETKNILPQGRSVLIQIFIHLSQYKVNNVRWVEA